MNDVDQQTAKETLADMSNIKETIRNSVAGIKESMEVFQRTFMADIPVQYKQCQSKFKRPVYTGRSIKADKQKRKLSKISKKKNRK